MKNLHPLRADIFNVGFFGEGDSRFLVGHHRQSRNPRKTLKADRGVEDFDLAEDGTLFSLYRMEVTRGV